MKRTQIYLEEEIFEYLERESQLEKKSKSEIIRDSIRFKMSRQRRNMNKSLDAVFGLWKNRSMDEESYIRSLRKDRKSW